MSISFLHLRLLARNPRCTAGNGRNLVRQAYEQVYFSAGKSAVLQRSRRRTAGQLVHRAGPAPCV
eukprot:6200032-Pleurochrysis_carterae.AAC.1